MSYSDITNDLSTIHPSQTRSAPTLSIVVPCYNEEAALPPLFDQLEQLSEQLFASGLITQPVELVLVDDGSQDCTWDMIQNAKTRLPVTGVKLSRNQGHQPALFAGLMQAKSDTVVSMDADLQDDPNAIIEMVEAYIRGADVVYGVRASRSSDTWFKRWTAQKYYSALGHLGVDLLPDHADFRLMSRKALNALSQFGETNLFMRALVRKLGLPSEVVTYERAVRSAGESKYNLSKMMELGLDGVTSFSVKPLRMIVVFGFLVAIVAFLFALFALVAWAAGRALPGWTSIVLPLSLLGGAHLVALGVIGEYVGKIYEETKRRPRFIVEEVIDADRVAFEAKAAPSMIVQGK